MKPPRRSSAAVIGLGLIGGSLALALRKRGWRVTGFDRDRRALGAAVRRGAIRGAAPSIAAAVRGARLVVLCVPFQAVAACLRAISAAAPRDAVVTDAASVKEPVIRLARLLLRAPSRFVGGHPMAGGERPGIANARADIFRGRICVVTPVAGTSPAALRSVRSMWAAAGARVVLMDPRRHDAGAAQASHLPHLIAYALAPVLANRDARVMASGSFLDATRVAASDPALWEGILLANRGEVMRAAAGQARRTTALLRMVRAGRRTQLRRALRAASGMRRAMGRSG